MKIKDKLLLAIIPLTLTINVSANNDITFGAGIGSMYSGLGANVGIVSETDLKYMSLGCVSYSSRSGSVCGFGLGWAKTDIFDQQLNKHAGSIYFGIVGSEQNNANNTALYGAGVGYHYFFNGISRTGTQIGVSIVVADENDGLGISTMFELGYQF